MPVPPIVDLDNIQQGGRPVDSAGPDQRLVEGERLVVSLHRHRRSSEEQCPLETGSSG